MKLLYRSVGFRRLDFGSWLSVGAFVGKTNYIKGRYGRGTGIELFAFPCRRWPSKLRRLVDWHIGIVKEWKVGIDYSGSYNDPYLSFTMRVGWFGIGARTPQWLVRGKEKQREQEYAKFADDYERSLD